MIFRKPSQNFIISPPKITLTSQIPVHSVWITIRFKMSNNDDQTHNDIMMYIAVNPSFVYQKKQCFSDCSFHKYVKIMKQRLINEPH